ncbi:TPA: hypothetical protein VGT17_005214 [Vibrio harveyi]|nr:hypothetical protein [Vibrio harveyi]HEQ3599246.1 hypothetical protein [Vibrio harveyi]HEQ3611304.1 hypothetical protein [Vibrio harveyi]
MSPDECWGKVHDLISLITKPEIVKSYTAIPAEKRPKGEYATLSLHKITPIGAPTTQRTKKEGALESTISIPCELLFEYTVYRGHAMDLGYLVMMIHRHELTRQFLIENGMAVWGVMDFNKAPNVVNQKYEDSIVPVIRIGATLTTTESVGFADSVEFSINGIPGEVKPEPQPKELNDESER